MLSLCACVFKSFTRSLFRYADFSFFFYLSTVKRPVHSIGSKRLNMSSLGLSWLLVRDHVLTSRLAFFNRKWCIKWAAVTLIFAWADLERTVTRPTTLIYVAHSPTNSILLPQQLVCSCPLWAWPLCLRACTNPWPVKCRTTTAAFTLRQWGSVAPSLQDQMPPRRKKARWSLDAGGGRREPQSQPAIAQVLDVRAELPGRPGSRPAQGGLLGRPEQRDIRSAPAGLRAASKASPA